MMSAWPRRAISSRTAGVRAVDGHPETVPPATADGVAELLAVARLAAIRSVLAGWDVRHRPLAGSSRRGGSGCSRPCRTAGGSRTSATSRATCRPAAGRSADAGRARARAATDSRIRFRSSSGTSSSGRRRARAGRPATRATSLVGDRRGPLGPARRCGAFGRLAGAGRPNQHLAHRRRSAAAWRRDPSRRRSRPAPGGPGGSGSRRGSADRRRRPPGELVGDVVELLDRVAVDVAERDLVARRRRRGRGGRSRAARRSGPGRRRRLSPNRCGRHVAAAVADVRGEHAIRWARSRRIVQRRRRRIPVARHAAAARSAAPMIGGRDRRRPSPARRRRAAACGLAALTPSGRARRPARVGAVRLREHDLQLRGRVVRDRACGSSTTRSSARRDGQFAFSVAIAVSVGLNAIVSPILGALSDRAGGRRLPFLLFFTPLCIVPTALIGQSPALVGLVLFAIANFAYQAALIYYDATLPDRQPARDARHAVRDRRRDRLLRDDLRRAPDLPARRAGRRASSSSRPSLFALFAIPIFLVVREPAHRRHARADRARAIAGSWRSCGRRSRTPGRCPGCGRFLLGPVLLLRRGQHDHRRDERRRDRGDGPERRPWRTSSCSRLTRRRGRRELRLGPRSSTGSGPKRTLMIVLASWAVGLVLGGISLGVDGPVGLGDVPARRGDPRQRARRRPGRRPGADGPALAARAARRVLRAVRARRQGLAGHRPAAVRRRSCSCS